jgi:hypothetical protein
MNEGRIDMVGLLRQSKPVSAETVEKGADGRLVSVTGRLESEQPLGDPGYLDFGPYIALNRKVEMYAWIEFETTEISKKRGSRKALEARFSYRRDWTDTPQNSDEFDKPGGHHNPIVSVRERSHTVGEANIGAYRFYPKSIELPGARRVTITKDNYVPSPEALLRGDYLFVGEGTIGKPQVGDIRISYTATEPGAVVTLFGKLNGSAVEPYLHQGKMRLYRLAIGPRDNVLLRLPASNKALSWALRLGAFLMMWIGLYTCYPPLGALSSLFPTIGDGKRMRAVVAAMAPVALGLSILVVLASWIAHNVLVLAIALAAPCAAWFLARRRSEPSEPQEVEFVQTAPGKRKTLPLQDEYIRKPSTGGDDEEQPPWPQPWEATSPTPPESEKSDTAPPRKPKPKAAASEIKFSCECCGLRYTVPASFGGRKARCHKCEHKFYIPPVSIESEPKPTVLDSSNE